MTQNKFQYSNPEFDAIVDELAVTADEAKVRELEHAAMEIWLQDMPDVNLCAVLQSHSQQRSLLDQLAFHGHRSIHERHSDAHRLPLHG